MLKKDDVHTILPDYMGISRGSSSSILPHMSVTTHGIHVPFHCSQECLYEYLQQHGENVKYIHTIISCVQHDLFEVLLYTMIV